MTTLALDTLRFSRELKKGGFTEKQAETLADKLGEIVEEQLVSKQYLDLRIAELKNDLIKWLIALLLGQAGLIVALLKIA